MSLNNMNYRHILINYRKMLGKHDFANKNKVLFELKVKYGVLFDTKIGEKIYEEIKAEYDH